MEHVVVTKASQEQVPFSREKLYRSLENAGADPDTILEIIQHIEGLLYPGISTKIIYRKAFERLKRKSKVKAAKYKLKQAILELGPTGFAFEKLTGALLAEKGYRIRTGITLRGRCVDHEIDVFAEKEENKVLVECKFHNRQGYRNDIKIPLYIQSRFEDIRQGLTPNGEKNRYSGWVVTNTRFTADALRYGQCAGLKLIAWDHPRNNGLKEMVDRTGLLPVTCLTVLTKREKKLLLDANIVFCKEITPQGLEEAGIKSARQAPILRSAASLVAYMEGLEEC